MKKSKKAVWTDFFKTEEVSSESQDWQGKILVLHPDRVAPAYRQPRFLLWKATGGFGCNPTAAGRAVFTIALADGERVRWDRADFAGVFTGKLPEGCHSLGS